MDTPSGGQHWYYRWPGFPVKSTVGIAPGVDIRSDGAYVVGPGSVIDGARYDYGLCPATIAELPEAFLQHLQKRPEAKEMEHWGESDTPIAAGHRNDELTRFAGKLFNCGCTHDEMAAALMARNQRLCTPPVEAEEVHRIAASAVRNFQQNVWPGAPPSLEVT